MSAVNATNSATRSPFIPEQKAKSVRTQRWMIWHIWHHSVKTIPLVLTQSSYWINPPVGIRGITALPFTRAHSICSEFSLLLPVSSHLPSIFHTLCLPGMVTSSLKAQPPLKGNASIPAQMSILVFLLPLRSSELRSAGMLFFILSFHHTILRLEH